ncbi:MAG: alkaline phosphatase D family protein [Pseudomonadota bacterium]
MSKQHSLELTRRGAIAAGAGAFALAAGQRAAAAAPAADQLSSQLLTRIAFGSCAKEDKDQPIWDAILATKPDLFIFLGDNIYADTRDAEVMRAKYSMLAAKPGFQKLKERVPILAIWDDHDYGENDAGADYPMKEESRRQFCDFWGESAASPRRTRDGVYASYVFGPRGRRVQVVLPDLRWNRTPIRELDLAGANYEDWAKGLAAKGVEVPGPYDRIPDAGATMLGETQWRWLDEQFAQQADVRIFGSSLQVIADFPGWEGWIVYANDHQRLFETIRRRRADGLVSISGDTHYGEISLLDVNTPYPMWDVTSSGLTEVWPVTPPNSRRVGEVYRDRNFGLIDIDWKKRGVTVAVHGEDGAMRLSQKIDLADLRVRP